MSTVKLDFVDSEYFEPEDENWHMKENAPQDLKEQFDEYMKYSKECEEKGVFI